MIISFIGIYKTLKTDENNAKIILLNKSVAGYYQLTTKIEG